MPTPNFLDEVAFIKVAYHAGGAVCITGMLDDAPMMIRLLEHARDQLLSRHKPTPLIVIPNRDVDVPAYKHEVTPIGDMPRASWGDR